MRLAESHKVPRTVFLEEYQGEELDANWLRRVSRLTKHGWKDFVSKEKDTIKEIRAEIHSLASDTGLQIPEFRRIVHAWCRRVSARRASPRRKWSRPTCVS
jgi:RNA polymerase primary sigma factor